MLSSYHSGIDFSWIVTMSVFESIVENVILCLCMLLVPVPLSTPIFYCNTVLTDIAP